MSNKILLSAYLPTDLIETVQPWLDFVFTEPIIDDRYISFYRDYPHDFKLLDNGLIERYSASIDANYLHKYAGWVNATHVVPPDRLGDWAFNLQQLLRSPNKFVTLPCLAGQYHGDFYMQAETVLGISNVDGYCLPYRLARHPLSIAGKHIHLLGLKWPEPYHLYTKSGAIVSLDTTEPINATFERKDYADKGFTTTQRCLWYKDLPKSGLSMDLLKDNIDWLKAKLNEGIE